ncbi:MAG: hypothetical protein ATN31_01815 [Candidatus Epulonipiscioides saccharophilum]|nr:MAG: hypothetical protein ATN31_01815 [Epulopiscium sp. AS2M-Bin001]
MFTIENYNKKSTFSSFLPGVSGLHGIPLWCYYVNRGQGVVSFGVQDKNHAIMEFYPAHQAYQNVSRTGFRTFIKKDNVVTEAFTDPNISHNMIIDMNKLQIEEDGPDLKIAVTYFTLPNEKIGALVRKLTIINKSQQETELQILDGFPSCIPYGVGIESMKMMGQTVKAWMQVEDLEKKVPYFKVRASMNDSATVTEVIKGNFSFGCLENGNKLMPIVDPDIIFGYDTSLSHAIEFENHDLEKLLKSEQIIQNQLPCSFYGTTTKLAPDQSITMYQVIGQALSKNRLNSFLAQTLDKEYFKTKEHDATNLTSKMTDPVLTQTANSDFDNYIKYTYMDNILRGGTPILLGNSKVFYAYSRKHGDIERDYNFFSLLPEYYSQGNGNFRDVNQNRRLDNFFSSFLGTENIHLFYDAIQLDGYNPLSIEQVTYSLKKTKSDYIALKYNLDRAFTYKLLKPFSPGKILMELEDLGLPISEAETILNDIIDNATSNLNTKFGEGYWTDHWTYNLDLLETYLEIYPEQEEQLLFGEKFHYANVQAKVNPRIKRYEQTSKGVRQYNAIEHCPVSSDKLAKDAKGEIISTTLIEKLILLCTLKYATLDPFAMGIEMEGGKPGWYDALNGLPGIFGSSMAETYELARNISYTIKRLQVNPDKDITLFTELNDLITQLIAITKNNITTLFIPKEVYKFWDEINVAKESYRDKVYNNISGDKALRRSIDLIAILQVWLQVIHKAIEKSKIFDNSTICSTYFSYKVSSSKKTAEGIIPQEFQIVPMPLFLEGPVRYLKLSKYRDSSDKLYKKIKSSDLYDKKLNMYKVNAPLKDASYEIGRAKAFTPGWLENESIWMHMEYKYLLEVLKSGMYKNFFNDLQNIAIPFLDPNVYGRSIYENSSFIASSANPNPNIHGRGFVARLSGSTIEFIHMWKIMMFGKKIFRIINNELIFKLSPSIPKYLLDENKQIVTTLLGNIKVIYHFDNITDYIPEEYAITSYSLKYTTSEIVLVNENALKGKLAQDIRNGNISTIEVNISLN